MPQELPGFYFDPEKNRYFPIKGPIPGTSRKKIQKPISLIAKVKSPLKKDLSKLLYYRELYGSLINVRGRNRNFEEEYKQKLISKPKVWRYRDVDRDAIRSLSLANIDVETSEGQCSTDALLAAGVNGSLTVFDVGFVGGALRPSLKTTADFIWPQNNEAECGGTINDIWTFGGATFVLPSAISGISMPRKGLAHGDTDGSAAKHALITTLGSESSGGALYVFNLADPVDSYSNILSVGRLRELASLNCTIWGADVNCSGSKAVAGTNLGVTLVDLETAVSSVLCRSKSDVLSVQLIHSDNIALCGLRNGAIVTLDVRQPQRMMARHRIENPAHDSTLNRTLQKTSKPCLVLRGNIQPSRTVYMPSSICCLESLQTYDQYFLASSMDGSIRLYDHRLTNRGPVQSYEGHVNTHSHIKLATDASERFVMSGGEDCKMRIWSIKSGELLFEEKLSSSIPLTSCWQRSGGFSKAIDDETQNSEDCRYTQQQTCDAWVGTTEGLLRMRFPE
ncbi:hypothetical protein vseg_019291 [Gypsophila vaccaria]